MAQQVVTELVIDANTAGADQFSQSMDKAGASAQQVALAVAGVGIAVVGIMAGLRSFVDYVGGINKQLIDLDDSAKLAGMSTREFQETLFAARAARLTEKDFVSGLDKIGQDLTQASRGVTDFGKLFEANGLSIKDTNGKLKDTKTALADIAGLMQNATPQVQQGIARIVGLSKDWVPFLRDGVDAIEEQKAAAERLGVILDDDVIQSAKKFDREWRLAIATWDTQLKASLIEILPMMVKLAGYAIAIVEAVGKVSGFFSHALTPVDQMSGSDLTKRLEELRSVRDLMREVGPETDKATQFQMGLKRGAVGLPEDTGTAGVDAEIARVEGLIKKKRELDGFPRVTINGSGTVLPATGGGDQNDPVDRAINSLRRHTEQQLADAKAVGQGAAALAMFRADAALTSAVQANGGQITAQQAAQFELLKQKAIAAAEALAKAKVAADIKFNRDTGFLSQEDVQIAQQLKQIYPDVATALGSVEATGIRLNNAMRGISSSFENILVSGLADITTGAKSASQGFQDMSKAIVRAIEEMVIKITIITPLMRALQMGLSSLGIGGSLFGGVAAPTAGIDGLAAVHHTGHGPGDAIAAMRYVHPAYFDDAPRYHTGIGPGERAAVIEDTEGVFTSGQMRALGLRANAAPIINVKVVNQTGVQASTETSRGQDGDITIQLKKMVEAIGTESIASGDMGRAITNKYGVKQFAGQ